MLFGLDEKLARLFRKVPGRKTLGIYRFQPLFFVLGAALEFSMIKWEAGPDKTNFYKTYTRTTAREHAEAEIEEEERLAKIKKTIR